MERYQIEDVEVLFDCAGRDDWAKFSFPVWYGIPVKIRWRGYRFDFNLRGGWKWIGGKKEVWPDPQEMLKRTDANGLMYYGIETYASDYDLVKNYYIPYNDAYHFDLFPAGRLEEGHVGQAVQAADGFAALAGRLATHDCPERVRGFLNKISLRSREGLVSEAELLHRIMGTTLPVLPPDTIDVDYEVIPLMIADGCNYNCRFCSFRDSGSLRVRSMDNIQEQIIALRDFYGDDLVNYNSLVLGQNDALAAGGDTILAAAEMAYAGLDIARSFHKGPPNLFLFGSVDPFLNADHAFFDALERLPYRTFLNIGLESFDEKTLSIIGKPLRAERSVEAFHKMMAVNRTWQKVTVSCNFVMGRELPARHVELLKDMLGGWTTVKDRGTAFMSPLFNKAQRREIMREFIDVKRSSHLPVYIYLAQRL